MNKQIKQNAQNLQESSSQQSSSSESQNEGLTQEQIQEKENQTRFRIIKVYQFLHQKQNDKKRKIFNLWKDEYQMKQRLHYLKSIKHYQNNLLSKGLDGIVQYAILSMSFKEKIVIFYYRNLIGNCFSQWKGLCKQRKLQLTQKGINSDWSNKIVDINKDFDQILENNKKLRSKDYNIQKKQKIQVKKQIQLSKQKKPDVQIQGREVVKRKSFKDIQYRGGIEKIKQIQSNKNVQSMKGELNDLEFYNPKISQSHNQQFMFANERDSKQRDDLNRKFIQSSQSDLNNVGIYYTYTSQRFMTVNQSRNNLVLDNSRRSLGNSAFNDKNILNKSQRKLKPVLQEIKLPSFGKNKQTVKIQAKDKMSLTKKEGTSNNQNTVYRKLQSYPKQQQQSSLKNEKAQLKNKREPQSLVYKQQDQQKQEKQLKIQSQEVKKGLQQQKRKQKQNRRNNILSLITKGKIMELSLIKCLPKQGQQLFQNYKNTCIETLKKIKSL